MGRHNPFEENDRDPGRGMGTLDVPYNPDMVFDFDYDYAHPRRSGSLPNQAALALPVGATSCTPIEPGVRVVIEDKAPQQVSFNAWAGEYENDESTGDQEDAGLSTRFPGNASPMSYSSIAGKGDSPPIEFDLDTSAYHRIMLKPTDHPGDRSRNLNERKVHHDSLPQPPRATPIPEDFSFEAKHSGPLLLEGDIMSSDPLGGEKRVGSVDICSPDDLGLQSRVSMKNGKPFKCKFPHCLTTGFRTLGSKQRHEREMHSLELKCLICDFSAKRLYQISNHTEAAHPEQIGDTPYALKLVDVIVNFNLHSHQRQAASKCTFSHTCTQFRKRTRPFWQI